MRLSLKPNKHDIFIGLALLILIISLVISLVTLNNKSATNVNIKYDGKIVHRMNLENDEVFIMHEGEDYPHLLGDFEITVKNGKVGITKNTCPEDFCKHLGWIDSVGYSLICAPNHIIVEITNEEAPNCDWGVC